MRIFLTGGAGFIGSALVRLLVGSGRHQVLNVDALTYAGNLSSVASVADSPDYGFLHADIRDRAAMRQALADFQPDVVTHLAAESHVDRSLDGPAAFVDTNVVGTATLLDAALEYYRALPEGRSFLFHHISTDEVFGSLGPEGMFTETTAYDPRSPYSASKAASDHMVRAWHHSFGLPVVVTNCSNNYGLHHFPEKLIPLVIIKAISGEKLPIYGKGDNIRDWLHVEDHARALQTVFEKGVPGETYLVGGRAERTNMQVVDKICEILDRLRPRADGRSYAEQKIFVADRPGHDQRYAIDPSKLERELGWSQQESFESGIEKTVAWYLDNEPWWRAILDGNYAGERLGLKTHG